MKTIDAPLDQSDDVDASPDEPRNDITNPEDVYRLLEDGDVGDVGEL